jgi:putative acetyltransferase
MFDLPNLTIRVESPETEDVRDLIERAEQSNSTALDELRAPNAEVLVARVNGQAVGCVALLDHLRYGEAKRLFVDAAARGQGIAAALVSALEAAARDLGIGRITIVSGKSHQMTPEFMQRFGFQVAEAAAAQGQAVLEKRL